MMKLIIIYDWKDLPYIKQTYSTWHDLFWPWSPKSSAMNDDFNLKFLGCNIEITQKAYHKLGLRDLTWSGPIMTMVTLK